MRSFYAFVLLFVFVISCSSRLNAQGETFSMTTLASNLNFPYEIVYGPDNNIWLTERVGGRVSTINPTNGSKTVLLTLGSKMVQTAGQDGLMGIAIHPEYNTGKQFVYIAYTYQNVSTTVRKTRIERYTLTTVKKGKNTTTSLASPVTIIENLPGSNDHNSGRLAIGPDMKLYYTIGDMGAGQGNNLSRVQNAQNLNVYEGKVLRLNLELINNSWIPADNPFVNSANVRTPVYTYGHRNAQGLVWGNVAGNNILYSTEHGPFSDDEINIIERGRNYGWAAVGGYCDGNYNGTWVGGTMMSNEQTFCAANNIKEPIKSLFPAVNPPDSTTSFLTWPTIAPSGTDFYSNSAIPGWQNSLLVACLKAGRVYRFKLDDATGQTVISDTIGYFANLGRFRDVCISPDGTKIYVCTDNSGSTSVPTGGYTSTPPNPGRILVFTYQAGARFADPKQLITTAPGKFNVYPVPASNELTISANGLYQFASLEMVSMSGTIVKQQNGLTSRTQLNVNTVPSGMYYVR
ncbi:MAG TPA: PQQ-dependent sugar dehydrogenase, partial [Chitinophagaceae bacterium]